MRLIVILFCTFFYQAYSQDGSSPEESADTTENEIFEVFAVSQAAVFPGGEEGLRKFIGENIKYPKSALESETQGVVVVQFVVDSSGNVGEFKILTPERGDGLEKEEIRVLTLTNGMWTPAKQGEKAVAMVFRMPINCALD